MLKIDVSNPVRYDSIVFPNEIEVRKKKYKLIGMIHLNRIHYICTIYNASNNMFYTHDGLIIKNDGWVTYDKYGIPSDLGKFEVVSIYFGLCLSKEEALKRIKVNHDESVEDMGKYVIK